MLGFARDPGGILTPNRWSRNPVRYTVAPRIRMVAKIEEIYVEFKKNNEFNCMSIEINIFVS
jgi:hypothetical protein